MSTWNLPQEFKFSSTLKHQCFITPRIKEKMSNTTAGAYKAFDKINLYVRLKLSGRVLCYTESIDKPTANAIFKWSNTEGLSSKVWNKARTSGVITVSQ